MCDCVCVSGCMFQYVCKFVSEWVSVGVLCVCVCERKCVCVGG